MILRGLGLVVPVAAALGAIVLGLPVPRARAQPVEPDAGAPTARDRAQELLQQGNELFRADRFADALGRYRAAQQVFPSPKILFNIARCEESLGQRAQALLHLTTFLKQAVDIDPLVRDEAERRMAQLVPAVATIDVSALPPHARIVVDAETVGLTPLEQPLWIDPGSHRVSVDRPGRPLWIGALEGKAGVTTRLAINEPTPPPGPPTASDREGPSPPAGEPSYWRRTRWIWIGVGVILAGAAATLITLKLRECPADMCR